VRSDGTTRDVDGMGATRARGAGGHPGTSVVPALMRVRVPAHADPDAVEAELVRAISLASGRRLTAELALAPLLGAEGPRASRVLTYALILHSAVEPGPAGADELVAEAERAASAAVKGVFGPQAETAAQPARSPEQLAACYQAVRGTPCRDQG
jgi:hypothetical protein